MSWQPVITSTEPSRCTRTWAFEFSEANTYQLPFAIPRPRTFFERAGGAGAPAAGPAAPGGPAGPAFVKTSHPSALKFGFLPWSAPAGPEVPAPPATPAEPQDWKCAAVSVPAFFAPSFTFISALGA